MVREQNTHIYNVMELFRETWNQLNMFGKIIISKK